MSRIAITLNEKEIDSKSLFKIKQLTMASLGEKKCKIEKKEPVFTGVLFYNDHDDISILLKKIINILDEIHLSYSIYELDEEARELDENQKITKNVLFRILDSQDEEIKRQQDIS
ncbi:hypothetical protein VSP10_17635 [Myroides odoratimimus]|uniref:hypothetical protein n=1 Tax=Myroides odoratimimus TaxID=76832 RepID=UPI002DBD91D3|nr:hypothetical protein [Myroides odoratimimus]MEC4054593.1 hypothetical protein [Myroides odoratimimus]